MKKLLIVITLMLPLRLVAQTSLLTTKPKEQFFTISFSLSAFSSIKGKIKVEFGRDTTLLKYFDKRVIDETQKVTECKTVADAFNYIAALGWEFVVALPGDVRGDESNSRYIFKRKLD